jgi:pre-mRNA-splicing factor 38B
MSRSALWRQEGNRKDRERRAEELFDMAVTEGKQRAQQSSAIVPLWRGSEDTFHFNPLLLKNTIHSSYFQKACQTLSNWNAVIDQIYYEVTHVQPFSSLIDKTPSTAFCLLLRLMTLRMTDHQLTLTLQHPDSPYIRAIGFLYLRFVGPPEQILRWIEPYLFDPEPIQVDGSGGSSLGSKSKRNDISTMGEFVRTIFDAREYFGTPLPRFPLPVERELRVRILAANQVAQRATKHYQNAATMKYFQTIGNEVMALYGDDENPTTWYKAVVDRVITVDDAGYALEHPKFVVTFTEYGNTETVLLGEMDMLQGNWKKEDPANDRTGSSSSSSSSRRHNDLYEEVRRRDRETVTASKGWARPPPSTKNMLTTTTSSHRTSVQDDDDRPPPSRKRSNHNPSAAPHRQDNHFHQPPPSSEPRKRTPEEMAAIAEKKRRLQAKYG